MAKEVKTSTAMAETIGMIERYAERISAPVHTQVSVESLLKSDHGYHAITTRGRDIKGLPEGYIAEHVSVFPENAYRMAFTDNHDKNSWEGNQYANFGDGLHAAMVLCATIDGMPLVYSGQEAGLARSLDFFEKDPIEWKAHENADIYKKLFDLKHRNQALWNGKWGGPMIRIKNDKMDHVLSFSREKNGDKVVTVINFSDQAVSVRLEAEYHKGRYAELFSGEEYVPERSDGVGLEPWGYRVLVKK